MHFRYFKAFYVFQIVFFLDLFCRTVCLLFKIKHFFCILRYTFYKFKFASKLLCFPKQILYFKISKAVAQRCTAKRLFLKILQIHRKIVLLEYLSRPATLLKKNTRKLPLHFMLQ